MATLFMAVQFYYKLSASWSACHMWLIFLFLFAASAAEVGQNASSSQIENVKPNLVTESTKMVSPTNTTSFPPTNASVSAPAMASTSSLNYMEGQKPSESSSEKYHSTQIKPDPKLEITTVHQVNARKGVDNVPSIIETENQNKTTNSSIVNGTVVDDIKPVIETTHVEQVNQSSTVKVPSSSQKPNSTTTITTKKPIPKKPTITLSADEAGLLSEEIPKPSPIPVNKVTSKAQMPDPQKSPPGFIVPIIITIFAVPLLGLLGYQAISRGKEAWRNRHYRRMDYLIDGMYND